MVLVFALAGRKNARNVRRLIEVHPQSAHGVVHAGENLHRRSAWIVAYKLLVNFQNAFELAIESGAINMRQVEIDHRLAINAEIAFINHLEDGAGRNIPRNQIAVLRIPLLEEIPTIAFRNRKRITLVAECPWYPDPPAFAARRLRHQPQLVFTRNRSWMDLNKFAVGVITSLLIQGRLCRTRAYNRVCALAENCAHA